MWHERKRHCAGCLSGGGKTHKLAARARRAVLDVIGLYTTEGYCTCDKPVSFGARPWCDVRVVTSNAQPAFAWHARMRHCAGCLSGGEKTRKLAARARRAALDVIGLCTGCDRAYALLKDPAPSATPLLHDRQQSARHAPA